ncbi:hypothetical protein PGB90_000150 [Kerria lacca]
MSMHSKIFSNVFSNSFSLPSNIAISSANLIVLTFCPCILTPDLLSFISSITFSINKLKRIGDRLQPCLTPSRILASPILSSTFISAFCSLYRFYITLLSLYFTPISFNILNNLAHSTLSNAFSRSTNATYVSSPFFSLFSNTSLKQKIASLVPLPLLNPNWSSPTLSSILPCILLCNILVKSLDACGNKLIVQ